MKTKVLFAIITVLMMIACGDEHQDFVVDNIKTSKDIYIKNHYEQLTSPEHLIENPYVDTYYWKHQWYINNQKNSSCISSGVFLI